MSHLLLIAAALTGQYAYGQGYTAQAYQPGVVYQFAPVLTSNEYYASMVAAQHRDAKDAEAKKAADEQIARIADAQEQQAKLLQSLIEAIKSPVQPVPAPAPTPQPPTPAPPTPQPPQPAPSGQLTAMPAAVQKLLTAKCVKCHTRPATSGGNAVLFEADGTLSDYWTPLGLQKVDLKTYGDMPPGKPIEPDEYSAIRAWVNANKDEILAAIKAAGH